MSVLFFPFAKKGKLIPLFGKDALNWSNMSKNAFLMLQEIFYSPKSLENQITVSTKILSGTTDFNIDNKCFLSNRSALVVFLKNYVTFSNFIFDQLNAAFVSIKYFWMVMYTKEFKNILNHGNY